mmetsp:Transcript_101056/g.309055  ORF Transcript_101056/g.309055 Transcript_101056/m.309055 type:complete len:203 (-) Transcript_101056:1291-1899(-)
MDVQAEGRHHSLPPGREVRGAEPRQALVDGRVLIRVGAHHNGGAAAGADDLAVHAQQVGLPASAVGDIAVREDDEVLGRAPRANVDGLLVVPDLGDEAVPRPADAHVVQGPPRQAMQGDHGSGVARLDSEQLRVCAAASEVPLLPPTAAAAVAIGQNHGRAGRVAVFRLEAQAAVVPKFACGGLVGPALAKVLCAAASRSPD